MIKKLSAKDISAIEVGAKRLKELQRDNDTIQQISDDQVGTEIPKVFTSSENSFIVDPSNVGVGVLDRMIKTDDTVSSAVQFKIMMILSKIGEYEHENKDIKKFVQGYLEGMRGPTWASAQEAMLSYHGYKFSVSEVVFNLEDDLKKVPKKIVTYHPATLSFEVDAHGDITEDGFLQYTQQTALFANPNTRFASVRYGFKVKNPFDPVVDRIFPARIPMSSTLGLVRIPKSKVIHFVGQEWNSFGSPYGNSGVRTAHLLWSLKLFLLRQLGIASKRKTTPKIWATAPKGAQQVDVINPDGTKEQVSPADAVRKMMGDVQDFDNIVTQPEEDGYKLTVLEDTADLNQYVATINAINVWIFRCFLLPSLVMTDGSAGSRSLGDKHFQVVDLLAESDADKFGEKVINQMIERTIIDNFGKQDNYGKFLRRPRNVEERQRLAAMFGQLGNDGWMSAAVQQDMSLVRDSLNLTPLEDSFFKPLEEDPDFTEGVNAGDVIPEGDGIPDADNHAQNAFNGAQVTSLVDLIKQVSDDAIPADAAIEILVSAFQMDVATATRIIRSAEAFEPKSSVPSDTPGTNPAPVVEDPEPVVEDPKDLKRKRAEALSIAVMDEVGEAFCDFIVEYIKEK